MPGGPYNGYSGIEWTKSDSRAWLVGLPVTWVPERIPDLRESQGIPDELRQPEIVWIAPLSQKLAQPRNTEEFL